MPLFKTKTIQDPLIEPSSCLPAMKTSNPLRLQELESKQISGLYTYWFQLRSHPDYPVNSMTACNNAGSTHARVCCGYEVPVGQWQPEENTESGLVVASVDRKEEEAKVSRMNSPNALPVLRISLTAIPTPS